MNAQAHFPVSLPPEGGNCKVDDLRKIVTKCVTTGENGGDVKYYLTEFFYHKSRLVLIELTTSFLVGEGAKETLEAKLWKNLRPTWHLKLCLSHSLRLYLSVKEGCPMHMIWVWSFNYYQSWAIVLDVRVWLLGKRVVSTVCHCKLSSFLCHVASSMGWWHPIKGNVDLTISLSQVNKWLSSCPVFSSLVFFLLLKRTLHFKTCTSTVHIMKMKMLIMWNIFYCFVLHQGHHVILILGLFLVCNQE